ncbi:MAG: dihydrofolate reductase [Parcubacteria group bacterium Gr01-1014_8]|nr:MAG: dihydrofolate reductase [Parcubacteria group bacterium Gr01-1014_8]
MEKAERCAIHNQRQPCGICRVLRNQRIGPEKGTGIVSAIAAIGKNRELGKGNELLWRIPDDMKRFKKLSMGHPIILGRKTFGSIVRAIGKPLPGRTNIVVTRDAKWSYDEVIVAKSLEEALEKAKGAPGSEEIIIGGGAQIYKQALPYTTRLYLTLIDDEGEADSFFPEYEDEFTIKLNEERHEWNGLKYVWVDLERT